MLYLRFLLLNSLGLCYFYFVFENENAFIVVAYKYNKIVELLQKVASFQIRSLHKIKSKVIIHTMLFTHYFCKHMCIILKH